MIRRDLILFFVLELMAIVLAALFFSILTSRFLAGVLAGLYFVVSGVFMLWRVSRWSLPWRSCTLYALLIHVFLISVPMMVTRWLQADQDFGSVYIYGIPGPVFHKISTVVFFGLIVATAIDWFRCSRQPSLNQKIS